MNAITMQLTAALAQQCAESKARVPAESSLVGRKRMLTETLKAALGEKSVRGDSRYSNADRSAFQAIQRQLGVSHADLMAYELSCEMAHNGDWNQAWEMVRASYEDKMPRDRWEAWLRGIMYDKMASGHHLIPIPS